MGKISQVSSSSAQDSFPCHISGLPSTLTEHDIRSFFSLSNVVPVQFMPQYGAAVINCGSIQDTYSLMQKNGRQINGSTIRVSCSSLSSPSASMTSPVQLVNSLSYSFMNSTPSPLSASTTLATSKTITEEVAGLESYEKKYLKTKSKIVLQQFKVAMLCDGGDSSIKLIGTPEAIQKGRVYIAQVKAALQSKTWMVGWSNLEFLLSNSFDCVLEFPDNTSKFQSYIPLTAYGMPEDIIQLEKQLTPVPVVPVTEQILPYSYLHSQVPGQILPNIGQSLSTSSMMIAAQTPILPAAFSPQPSASLMPSSPSQAIGSLYSTSQSSAFALKAEEVQLSYFQKNWDRLKQMFDATLTFNSAIPGTIVITGIEAQKVVQFIADNFKLYSFEPSDFQTFAKIHGELLKAVSFSLQPSATGFTVLCYGEIQVIRAIQAVTSPQLNVSSTANAVQTETETMIVEKASKLIAIYEVIATAIMNQHKLQIVVSKNKRDLVIKISGVAVALAKARLQDAKNHIVTIDLTTPPEKLKMISEKIWSLLQQSHPCVLVCVKNTAIHLFSESAKELESASTKVNDFFERKLEGREEFSFTNRMKEFEYASTLLKRKKFMELKGLAGAKIHFGSNSLKIVGKMSAVKPVAGLVQLILQNQNVVRKSMQTKPKVPKYFVKKVALMMDNRTDDVMIVWEKALPKPIPEAFEPVIIVVALDQMNFSLAVNKIKDYEQAVKEIVPFEKISKQEANKIANELENYNVDCKVIFAERTKHISIAGDAESVKAAKEHASEKLKGVSVAIRVLPFKKLDYKYLTSNFESISGMATQNNVKAIKQDETCSLSFKGTIQGIKTTIGNLNQALAAFRQQVTKSRLDLTQEVFMLLRHKHQEISKIESTTNVSIELKEAKTSFCIAKAELNGVAIKLVIGNIISIGADVIVNAANEQMQHNAGIAKAIIDAAGNSVNEECQRLLKERKKQLKEGDILCTSAGNLNASVIVHAVGPRWSGGRKNEDMTLQALVAKCLDAAENKRKRSICIPAISSGIFGFTLDASCGNIIKGIAGYIQNDQPINLRKVILIAPFADLTNAWLKAMKSHLGQLVIKRADVEKILKQVTKEITAPAPVPKSSPVSPYRAKRKEGETWYWLNDDKEWVRYREPENKKILEMRAKGDKKFNIKMDNEMYEIDIQKKTQTKIKTGFQRQITNSVPVAKNHATWEWEDDMKRGWKPYNAEICRRLEAAYLKKQSKVELSLTRHLDDKMTDYYVDLAQMKQINSKTNFSRNVRRVAPVIQVEETESHEDEDDIVYDDEESATTTAAPVSTRTEPISKPCLVVSGYDFGVKPAVQMLDALVQSLYQERTIRAAGISSAMIDKISKKFNVTIRTVAQDSVAVRGIPEKMVEACAEILEQCVQDLQTSTIHYPPEWNMKQDFSMLALDSNSKEYQTIVAKLAATYPNCRVLQIDRIENKHIWKQYYHQLQIIKEKNGYQQPFDAELLLFHGTKNTTPDQIYNGYVGFDVRFSPGGMWGRGTYFAENASYSCANFAHESAPGVKQVFYARVAVGDCVHLATGASTLTIPPEKQTQQGKFAVERYDSVSGVTGGSKVYIVYDNRQAYPAYLITFMPTN